MASQPVRRRLDFKTTFEPTDDPARFTVIMEPDPRRYEWVEKDGKEYLVDRLGQELIPKSVLHDMASAMDGLPLFYQPPLIDDAQVYIESRRTEIATRLRGERSPQQDHQVSDPSAEFLKTHQGSQLGFAVMSVDLVGSTALATKVDPTVYERFIATLLDEISRIVTLFRGQVLKYTGDGLLAYFAEPSFITKNDLALDCALTIRGLVLGAINVALESQGDPPVAIRIGIEAGDAIVVTLGHPSTKRQADIVGVAVSLAAKIQAIAPVNGICLGEAAVAALHLSWRERTRPFEAPIDWTVQRTDGSAYPVREVI